MICLPSTRYNIQDTGMGKILQDGCSSYVQTAFPRSYLERSEGRKAEKARKIQFDREKGRD